MRCTSCGADNDVDARFCSSCGHALTGRGDERRVVTVLFADLVGFTHLSETRDPEQVKNLVDRCFERLAEDITAFGGRIDKVIGDAILALFGAPVAHEDDAERAVRAALRMQHTLRGYVDEAAAEIRMRVGVNTGEVLVGSLRAGGDYTAMGDVVNTAQRLQASAEPGTVLVGPATYAATSAVIEYRDAGLLQAKGRDEPVPAHVALEPLLPPGHRRRRRATPFVGRDAELGLLTHAAHLAATRRRAELVVLAGEAGVGKSRLAEEVAARARTELGATVLEGRCVPYGEANVWWPVAEAVRQSLGLLIDEAQAEAVDRTAAAVADALGPAAAETEVARVQRGLLSLLGYETALREIDPGNARAEILRSVQAYLGGLARPAPLVLVLSDLHWADPVVLDLIETVLARQARSPLVVVATARGELLDRWTPPVGRHNGAVVHLDPLDAAAAGTLLAALAPEVADPELTHALLDRSGGNPFFLEELLALVSTGGLPEGAGAAAPGGEPPAAGGSDAADSRFVRLPDTLRGLVAARLDALGPTERTLIDNAAVWGRSGPVLALARMVESVGITDLDGPMATLTDRELLVLDGDRWRFRSDLIREVAYATLTKADRARRHAGIAAYLERNAGGPTAAGDRLADVTAFHFGAAAELAQDLGPVDGLPPDLLDRAVRWLDEAAARAWAAQMHPVAARLFGQGVTLLDGHVDARRARFLLGWARALGELRELERAGEAIEEATALAGRLGDPDLSARALLALGDLEQKRGHAAASVATLRAAAEALDRAGDRTGRAEALRLRGLSLLMSGEYAGAEASIQEALAAYRDLKDRRGEAWALQNLAWIAYLQGTAPEALGRLEEAGATFEELGDAVGLSWVRGLLAFVRFHLGQFDLAEDLGEQVLLDARQRGDRWGEGMMLVLVAGVRLWSGRAPSAVLAARDALDLFRAAGDRFGESQATGFLARAEVLAGDVAEGLDRLTEGLDRGVGPGGAPEEHRRILATALAGAAVQLGDLATTSRALTYVADQGLALHDIGDADVLVARGLAQLLSGQVESAQDLLLLAVDPAEDVPASAYARAALALAAACAGDDVVSREAEADVLVDERATYADRHLALVAGLVRALRAGGPVDEPLAAMRANLVGVDDAVTHAMAALIEARALAAVDGPGATAAAARADAHLAALGVADSAWSGVVDRAVATAAGR